MIDYMHKSAGVELLDQSKLVGTVIWYNDGMNTPNETHPAFVGYILWIC